MELINGIHKDGVLLFTLIAIYLNETILAIILLVLLVEFGVES
jgi:hypothetical protein